MSAQKFFATPELLLMLCESLLSQRDVVSVMKVSKSCHFIVLHLVWSTVVGVQNLIALLSDRSRLGERREGETTVYQIPASFSPKAIARFRRHAQLVRHIHIYDRQALFKWAGLASLEALGPNPAPLLRTIEICKQPTSSRAVQDLDWVRLLMCPSVTSLKVTSNSKDAMQIWTSDEVYAALAIVKERGARLTDLSIFANRTTKAEADPRALYRAERLIGRLTTITCLSVSAYQVDLRSLELFGSMHLRSFHIQGFGSSPQNWGAIATCTAPFAELTELKVYNFLAPDVLALLGCHVLTNGLLAVSLSFAPMTSIDQPLFHCMQRLAASSLGLTDFSVEFHGPVHRSNIDWLSQLAGLSLRCLSVRDCYISMRYLGNLVPLWPSLESLCLSSQIMTVEHFSVFASCPTLSRVELHQVESGPNPVLPPDVGQDLVVSAGFTLGRMSKKELATLARRLLSTWRSVTLVNALEGFDGISTGDRNMFAYLSHLLYSDVL